MHVILHKDDYLNIGQILVSVFLTRQKNLWTISRQFVYSKPNKLNKIRNNVIFLCVTEFINNLDILFKSDFKISIYYKQWFVREDKTPQQSIAKNLVI